MSAALVCRFLFGSRAGIQRFEPVEPEHRAEKWEPVFRLKRCDNK